MKKKKKRYAKSVKEKINQVSGSEKVLGILFF